MSEDSLKQSTVENEESSVLFVLDFLYHDGRRIGSFLSQFEADGHLQQTTLTKSGSRGKKEGSEHNVKASAAVASGTLQGSAETNVGMTQGYSKVFDPFWANARAFLDYANDKSLIAEDIQNARIGQFVRVSGWLSVLDLAMLKDAWKLPAISNKIKAGTESKKSLSQMTAAEKTAHKESKENTNLFLEMIHILPHSIHATLLTNGEKPSMTWCALKEEYLVSSPSELILAHGTMLGEWTIVGILTAKPEFETPDLSAEMDTENIGLLQSLVGQLSALLAPTVRVMLGRPAAAHAVTPLLIFRQVS